MNKHNCPNCGSPSITVWQKLGLGPLRKIKCKLCGAFISVPWFKSMFFIGLGTFTPLLGFLTFSVIPKPAGLVATVAGFSFGIVLGIFMFLWLYNRYVHLVVKHA